METERSHAAALLQIQLCAKAHGRLARSARPVVIVRPSQKNRKNQKTASPSPSSSKMETERSHAAALLQIQLCAKAHGRLARSARPVVIVHQKLQTEKMDKPLGCKKEVCF